MEERELGAPSSRALVLIIRVSVYNASTAKKRYRAGNPNTYRMPNNSIDRGRSM